MSNISTTRMFLQLQFGVRITMSTTLLLVHHSDPVSLASIHFESFRMAGMAIRRFSKNSVLSTKNFHGRQISGSGVCRVFGRLNVKAFVYSCTFQYFCDTVCDWSVHMKVFSISRVKVCWMSFLSLAESSAAWSSSFGIVKAFISATRAFPKTKANSVELPCSETIFPLRKATALNTSSELSPNICNTKSWTFR